MQYKTDTSGAIVISDEDDDALPVEASSTPTRDALLSATAGRVEHPASPVFVADAISQEGEFGDPSGLLMQQLDLDEIQNLDAAQETLPDFVSPADASSNGSPTLQNQFDDMDLNLGGSGEDHVPEVADELDNLTMGDGGGDMAGVKHPEDLTEGKLLSFFSLSEPLYDIKCACVSLLRHLYIQHLLPRLPLKPSPRYLHGLLIVCQTFRAIRLRVFRLLFK